jgi:hypothetical protein
MEGDRKKAYQNSSKDNKKTLKAIKKRRSLKKVFESDRQNEHVNQTKRGRLSRTIRIEPVRIGHGHQRDLLLHNLLQAALHLDRVITKVVPIHIANDQDAANAVRRGDGLHLVELVRLDLGLNVKVLLTEIPPHVVERVALDGACDLRVGVYVRHLVDHVRVARDRGRKVNGQSDEGLGRLTIIVHGRLVLGQASIGAAVLAAHAGDLEALAVQHGGHLAQATPLDGRFRVAVRFALQHDRFARLRVDICRDARDIGRTEDVQLGQLENLTLGVGDLALDGARVRLLHGPEHELVDLVALLASAQSIVERVGDVRPVADYVPRGRVRLLDAPNDRWLDLLGRVHVLEVAADLDRLARSRLHRKHLDLLDLHRALLTERHPHKLDQKHANKQI